METSAHTMKRLLTLPALCAAVSTALATGDFYEETVPALPVFLSYDRLPKKSLLEIEHEVAGQAPGKDVAYPREIAAIAAAIKAGKPLREQLPKIEELLTAERARRDRPGSGLNALLHDLRDLCSGTAENGAASEYLEWRLGQSEWFGYHWKDGRERGNSFWLNEEGLAAMSKAAEAVQARLDTIPAAVRPHYHYAVGALEFMAAENEEARETFAQIVAGFPDHPRAEVARYMVARCLYRQCRVQENDEFKNDPIKIAECRKALAGYLQRHPQGRFAGDVLGWQAGLDLYEEKYASALKHFIQQATLPGHPEFLEPATASIEKCFRRLHEAPDELAGALSDARVAQAAVYFAVNEIEPVDGNGEYESGEFVAAWRKKLLVSLGAALEKKPELFQDAAWKPRYVAAMAMAASGNGDQERALKLLAGADTGGSDDVAFARGVALQRAKRSGEAAAAFEFLAQKFPQSPLKPAAQVRRALALIDAQRAGEAAVVLMGMREAKKAAPPAKPADLPVEEPEEEEDEDIVEGRDGQSRDLAGVGPASPGQVLQLLDTVLNFAPLPELAAAIKATGMPEAARMELRSIVAVRHLAAERFAEARPFMPPAQWDQTAGPLAELQAAAQAAKTPAEKAATAAKLANAWAAARGKLLTAPLDTEEWRREVFKDDHGRANFRRVENGPALGFKGPMVLDLENRDELRHAFNWWLAASDAQPKTPAAATAVWKALRAMPDIAQVSTFTLDRAATKKWEDTARKLYDRLEKEHPAAPETKRLAVWWTFPPGKTEEGQPMYRWELNLAPEKGDPGNEETPFEEVVARVNRVVPADKLDLATLRKEVASGRRWAKEQLDSLPAQCVVNFFEDLDLFLATPELAPEVVKRYVELRYDTLVSGAIGYGGFEPRNGKPDEEKPGTVRGDDELLREIQEAKADPKFAGVADFLGFLELAVTANHWVSISMKDTAKYVDKDGEEPTYWGRDYAALEKLCWAWLEKNPKSKKREAALLLHCRALRHAMEPYVYYRRVSWPVAPRWEGAFIPEKVDRLKFDAKGWKAALDRYDKEFPKGAYADDVLGYRADLAVRLKDWKRALQITLEQAQGKPHLQPGAQNRLKKIFAHLANDEDRADLLAAIRATGGARAALTEELNAAANTPDHPLTYLEGWLKEEAEQ